MQYIQLQPQNPTDIPAPEVGSFNLFLDVTDNNVKLKDDVDESAPIGGGGVSFIEVTYSELFSRITGSTLSPGAHYLITDFKTCYDQPDYDYNKNAITSGIYRDDTDIQPILVFATSANTISTTAYQPAYPNDRIQYDWTFSTTERTGGVAYGRISERIDEFNNRTDYDHRQIKFKRYRYYEYSLNNPYNGTVQVSDVSSTEMLVSGTGTNFLSIVVGNKVGFDNSNYKIFEVTNVVSDTEMTVTGLTNTVLSPGAKMYPADWDEYSSYYQNNVQGGSQFEEYYTFEGSDNFNNYIGNHANLYDWYENDFLLANNVFHDRFIGNKFGDSCYNNTFFDDCHDNNIGNEFYNNITDDDFDGNVIGNEFYNNRITANFQYNRIGERFYNNYIVQNDFYRNNIMNDFRDNEISGGDFQNNEIGNQFNNNIVRNGQFYKNDIGNGFNGNKVFWNFYGNLIGNGFIGNNLYCEFSENTIGELYGYNGSNTIGDINDPSSYVFNENKIGNNFYSNVIIADFYKNQVGVEFNNNDISGQTTNNVIDNLFQNNTIYNNFINNKISNEFKGNMMLQEFEGNNIESFVGGNEFSGGTYFNNIGEYTFNNDFLGYVANNTWGDSFNSNTIDNNFENNVIGTLFQGNTISFGFEQNQIGNFFNGNIISNYFQNNEIGSFFEDNTVAEGFGFGGGQTQKNYIGDYFQDNNIGEYFYNNRVGNNFTFNTVGNYFQWNVIDTSINTTDFTTNYGNINAFTYTSTGSSATDSAYIGLTGTTNGIGVDATFDIEVSGNTVISVSGNTQGRLYETGDVITILGNQIGGYSSAIADFDDDAIGKNGADGSYTLTPTGGTGNGATFDIGVNSGLVDSTSVNARGAGYQVGDTLTIIGSLFGGTDGVDDITITVTALFNDDVVITITGVSANPSVYETYTCNIFERQGGVKRLSFYDSSDILTIKNINE